MLDPSNHLEASAEDLAAAEAEEVELAKRADALVWSTWYDRYYGALYRYAYARLGHQEEAEDIAAQVFVQAIAKIDGYRYRGRPVLAWLYSIARNLVTDRQRRVTRTTRMSAVEPEAPGQVDALIDSIALRNALARLTEDQREVLVLRFWVGLSTQEIASLLARTPASVYSLQVRAVASLRRLIERP
jgi:RNA polymerase sigma-70 factor (ECF subfamily)